MKWVTTILSCCVCALFGLGLVMLYSSSTWLSDPKGAAIGAKYLILQLAWGAMGLVLCITAACTDYRQLKKFSPFLLGFAAVLLLMVFAPYIGIHKNGASRWIGHGGLRFQPSELAKFALIIFLAHYCEHYQRQMRNVREGIVIPGAVIGLVLGLIFIEPDRGCAILLAAVSGCMLVIAGVRLRIVIPPIMAALACLAYSLLHDPMRLKRIFAWLHPEESKSGAGFQAYQGMIALGSGGWTGLGLGNGRQKLGFVPEHHTDFILPIIGEELGLIVTLAVVATFVVLIICCAIISRRACDTFGLLLGAGITFIIGFQAFINIGVVTCTLPNKGMPLPFISYGGSNLVMMFVGIGILLSISRFALEPEKKKKNPFETRAPELADA